MPRTTAKALATTFFVITTSTAALAQAVAPSVDSGVVSKQFEEKRTPKAGGEPLIPSGEQPAKKGLDDKKVFALKDVSLKGVTVYKNEDLERLWKDKVGQQVSLADLSDITRKITNQYRKDGYILSRAVLSSQKVKEGVVSIEVLEGYIDNITVNGDANDSRGLVNDIVAKIKNEKPISAKKLERYLLLIDDLPGMTAKAVVKASTTNKAAADLIVNLERKKFEGAVIADNRGSRTYGRYRGVGVATFNNALGIYDRTTFRGLLTAETDEMRFGEITHEETLNSEGLNLALRGFVVDSNAGGLSEPLDIEGSTQGFEASLQYPILRSRARNWDVSGGFNLQNSKTDVLGTQVSEDHVRSLVIATDYDFSDSWKGVSNIHLDVEHGLDMFGATDEGAGRSRANGKQDFTKFGYELGRSQVISGPWSIFASTSGQLTNDALLSSEEFVLGGSDYGRGYDAGEISGDEGWAYKAELRYAGSASLDWLESYQIYTFIDGGIVWNNDLTFGDSSKDSLTSAGLGTRFNIVHDWSGNVELSAPINKNISAEGGQGENPRVFFNVIKRF